MTSSSKHLGTRRMECLPHVLAVTFTIKRLFPAMWGYCLLTACRSRSEHGSFNDLAWRKQCRHHDVILDHPMARKPSGPGRRPSDCHVAEAQKRTCQSCRLKCRLINRASCILLPSRPDVRCAESRCRRAEQYCTWRPAVGVLRW